MVTAACALPNKSKSCLLKCSSLAVHEKIKFRHRVSFAGTEQLSDPAASSRESMLL